MTISIDCCRSCALRPSACYEAASDGSLKHERRISSPYHWLVEFLEVFSGYGLGTSVFFFMAFCVYLGFDYAVYALLYRALRKRGWSTVAIAVPILLLMEWVYPALFPTYIANSLHMLTWATQIADLGGPLLISALIGTVNVAVYETWRWAKKRRSAPKLIWGCCSQRRSNSSRIVSVVCHRQASKVLPFISLKAEV